MGQGKGRVRGGDDGVRDNCRIFNVAQGYPHCAGSHDGRTRQQGVIVLTIFRIPPSRHGGGVALDHTQT